MSEYFRPQSLSEAIAIAARDDVTVAAGCTDLFAATQAKALSGSILDVTAIEGMGGITRARNGWRIGGAASWSDILAADLPPVFDALKQAAREVGSAQIQNAGTIAGNLCNASPAADGVPPLLMLDARVELAGAKGTRTLPLADFLLGPRRTALARGELLSAVTIPDLDGASQFRKLGARRYLVISIVMVAVRLSAIDGLVRQAAIAVGACAPTARRMPAQERALLGKPLSQLASHVAPGLIEPDLAPIDDIRADAAYRRGSASVLVRRAVADLAEQMAR